MNFYDTISGMGYEIKDKDENKISIQKVDGGYRTTIVFDKQNKILFGCISMLNPIVHLSQVSSMLSVYKMMQEDLNKLSNESKYDILYRR